MSAFGDKADIESIADIKDVVVGFDPFNAPALSPRYTGHEIISNQKASQVFFDRVLASILLTDGIGNGLRESDKCFPLASRNAVEGRVSSIVVRIASHRFPRSRRRQ